MKLTSTGLLTGIPAEVEKRTRYTFVVRATAGSLITDRSFYLDVEGQDNPTFTTASGRLQLDDSTSVGVFWVLDGAQINFQVQGFSYKNYKERVYDVFQNQENSCTTCF